MKHNLITIVLVALVVLNILDGDFANPSWLDYIKFALIAVALILSFIAGRRKPDAV
jgi:protein-S-isoprenylcysteine O-methyltransferase Ste14